MPCKAHGHANVFGELETRLNTALLQVRELTEKNGVLTGWLKDSVDKEDATNRLYEEARNLNHDLADMVRCLEWTDPKGEVPSHCPWCEVQKPKHDNPCKLKIVIDKGYIPNKRKCEVVLPLLDGGVTYCGNVLPCHMHG